MNQLTSEQIKTLEDAFTSYPENFTGNPKFTTMEGIKEQLKSPWVDIGGNVYVVYETPRNSGKYGYGFTMNKMIIKN